MFSILFCVYVLYILYTVTVECVLHLIHQRFLSKVEDLI